MRRAEHFKPTVQTGRSHSWACDQCEDGDTSRTLDTSAKDARYHAATSGHDVTVTSVYKIQFQQPADEA